MKNPYIGADLIADFISKFLNNKVFLVTGGACAFMVDAIWRNQDLTHVCFQHEQSAAMAADAVWRTTGKIGVTMATSGPGATNLITGIACSWFDSIPTFHITGQVNQSESSEQLGIKVRQAGFQETDIVSMVKGITKYAKKITSEQDLSASLVEAYKESISGRKGPVLLDIPMDVQKLEISEELKFQTLNFSFEESATLGNPKNFEFVAEVESSRRPLVLIGGGAYMAGTAKVIQKWCENNRIPHVTSWAAISGVDRESQLYYGSIGVYGSRVANTLLQSADAILVFGSRLDNRQRGGNASAFAPFARKIVFDIDSEELAKFKLDSTYKTVQFDLKFVSKILNSEIPFDRESWLQIAERIRSEVTQGFDAGNPSGGLNPYEAVIAIQEKLPDNAIIVSDCGANLCWVYQSFQPSDQLLFTAGGNSPMGYSLPASIGAQFSRSDTPVVCFIGDGGLQMNVQELQTIIHYRLPILIVIQNNFGYGIIKQFQDAYFEGRHVASGDGYSVPDFSKLAAAFGIDYAKCSSLEDIEFLNFDFKKTMIVDLHLPEDALITPKLEMNRFLHDQFPYSGKPLADLLPFKYPETPSLLNGWKPN